uniref:ACB domain-containing protein n=1 Tax=Nothobranchius furzeri TaxID=105023 RepID=A0A8C6M483_NOTFU
SFLLLVVVFTDEVTRCYQPSYEVMLRFYSLYKQAMCGPCAVPRPVWRSGEAAVYEGICWGDQREGRYSNISWM